MSKIPAFGLGTFRLQGQQLIDSVSTALELGYRSIDTAQIYDNEAEVGQAVAASGIPRDQLFLTTKIWVEHMSADKLLPSLMHSLDQLRTDHLDLTLIHWPAPRTRHYRGRMHDGTGAGAATGADTSYRCVQLQYRSYPAGHCNRRQGGYRNQPD